ncbi:hypothetical protein V6Z11_A04G173100 [Gossypium hirsutum]
MKQMRKRRKHKAFENKSPSCSIAFLLLCYCVCFLCFFQKGNPFTIRIGTGACTRIVLAFGVWTWCQEAVRSCVGAGTEAWSYCPVAVAAQEKGGDLGFVLA